MKSYMKVKQITILIGGIWLVLLTGSFFWNYVNLNQDRQQTALSTARSFFNMVLMSREWNARHTVYVVVTDKTKPNEYLKVHNRDLIINDELALTMMNPAYMTREISEISFEKEGIRFHLTSLNPIRPANKPTELEAEILKDFENGVTEKGMFITKGEDEGNFFYMAPLETTEACLKCHQNQGYEVGDIRGGISVTFPFQMNIPIPLLTGHTLIGVIGLIGIFLAGGKVESAYKELKRQALYDTLTDIPNRQAFTIYFDKELKRCIREKENISIIMCDIDNFKSYNDNYGHIKGDKCLKNVAQTIKNTLNRPADFCARFGGEEFIIILPNTKPSGAEHLAEKIRKNIENKSIEHKFSKPHKIVTVSLGVTTLSAEGNPVSPERLLQVADTAMYEAKNSGKNCVKYLEFVNDENR
ncbi:MAG: diguanylate cyclase [Denitrovibrio sp.]|nr:MAG: diguanylate cyclase [Denitrovibrio sp.]